MCVAILTLSVAIAAPMAGTFQEVKSFPGDEADPVLLSQTDAAVGSTELTLTNLLEEKP